MKILFIGDIIGKPGRSAVRAVLPKLIDGFKIDFVIANGENSAGGFGITEKIANEFFDMGIHVITSGNHIWDKKESIPFIIKENRVLRPINYPPGAPGCGSIVIKGNNGVKVGVLNVAGRVFMLPIDCPFRTTIEEVERLRRETNIIIVDMHAEATSEKQAFGYYLDGKVSAVIGTHTHVQTADEGILPRGTAYITDAGMSGPVESIIGVQKEQIIEKFLYQIPRKFEVASGTVMVCGVIVEIDKNTGLATHIQRIRMPH